MFSCHSDCSTVLAVAGLSGESENCKLADCVTRSSVTASAEPATPVASHNITTPSPTKSEVRTGTLTMLPPCGPIIGNAGKPDADIVDHAFAMVGVTTKNNRLPLSVATDVSSTARSVSTPTAVLALLVPMDTPDN